MRFNSKPLITKAEGHENKEDKHNQFIEKDKQDKSEFNNDSNNGQNNSNGQTDDLPNGHTTDCKQLISNTEPNQTEDDLNLNEVTDKLKEEKNNEPIKNMASHTIPSSELETINLGDFFLVLIRYSIYDKYERMHFSFTFLY